jgi:diacylglycerol kinase (ATP)
LRQPNGTAIVITVIINPIAGRARTTAARDRSALASAVLAACGESGEVFITERRGHAGDLAWRAAARGDRLVIAWGGDGTMNEVGAALVRRETPMALVPAGSGNGLARELGISRRPRQALVDAIGAAARRLDAGELGGRLFFNVAGVGFDAHVAACLDRDRSGRRGFGAYARIALSQLRSYRSAMYRLDEAADPQPAFLITLANAPQFGNGARIAPAARPDDGHLDLVVFEAASPLAVLCAVPRLFVGGVARLRGVMTRQVDRITICSDGPMTFHVDGEAVQGGTRLEGRVLPGALKICVR